MTRRFHIVALSTLWVVVHVLMFWKLGFRSLHDADLYLSEADRLLQTGSLTDSAYTFYLIPISLLAVLQTIFGDPTIPYLVVQILVSALATIVLYKTASHLFKRDWAGFFAVLIYLCWWDNLQWNSAVLTESLFCSVTILLLHRFVIFDGSLKHYLAAGLLMLTLLLIRPTGLVVIAAVIPYFVHRHFTFFKSQSLRLVMLFLFMVIVAYLGASLLSLEWDFTDQYARGNIVTYMDTMEGKELYRESLQLDTTGLVLPDPSFSPLHKMFSFAADNPLHFIKAFVLKIGYLVSGGRPYYDAFHNSYILLYTFFVYLLCFFAYRDAAIPAVNTMCVSIIIANCFLVGISTVDWDNRFYMPMLPAVVLMAGGGAAKVLRLFRR